MVLFLLKQKWRFYFLPKNIPILAGQFFTAIQIILLFVLGGMIYSYTFENATGVQPQTVFFYINLLLVVLPSIFYFFPGVRAKESLFQNYYPIRNIQKSRVEFVVSVFSKISTITFLIAPVILLVTFKEFSFPDYFQMTASVISGILAAELFLTLFYLKNRWPLVAFICTWGLTIYYSKYVYLTEIFWILIIVLLVLNLIAGTYYNIVKSKDAKHVERQPHNNKLTILSAIMLNRKFLSIVTLGVLFQAVLVLVGCGFLISEIPFVIYACILPLGIFSYCYNNIWGFFPSYAINYILAGRSIFDFVLLYLRLLVPILILSQLLNFLCVYLAGGSLSYQILLTVTVMNCFAIINGIYFSFLSMRKINKAVTLNTNFNYSDLLPLYFVSILGVLLGIVVPYKTYFYLLITCISCLVIIQTYLLFRYGDFFIKKFKLSFTS